jgi:fermentation-respiration switch protein FrsA (DUF1100 family)
MFKATMIATGLAVGLVMSSCSAQSAQDGEIRVERVEFSSGGEGIVGDLYVADGVSRTRPGPAIVVTGAWMTVRQQMAARYARKLAERGYTALVFDYRGWGESGGDRRQYEDPHAKTVDTRAAFSYLASRPDIDDARLGGLGICASAGYMVGAALDMPMVHSIALVAPWLHDRDVVLQTYGGDSGVAELIESGRVAEAEYRDTGQQRFVPAASSTDRRAIMFGAPYYTEPDRGMITAWRNEADPAFWEGWLAFDGVAGAPRLSQPLFMVHSESAAIPEGAKRFYSRVTAPKSELWLDNVSQFDFYDRAGPVESAVAAVALHFARTL